MLDKVCKKTLYYYQTVKGEIIFTCRSPLWDGTPLRYPTSGEGNIASHACLFIIVRQKEENWKEISYEGRTIGNQRTVIATQTQTIHSSHQTGFTMEGFAETVEARSHRWKTLRRRKEQVYRKQDLIAKVWLTRLQIDDCVKDINPPLQIAKTTWMQ